MAYGTIKLKKYADVIEEREAAAAIIPGMLLKLNSSNKVEFHSTAGGNTYGWFATEDSLQGKGIDDDYETGDIVTIWIPGKGDEVNALIADDTTCVIGDLLESNGDGKLRVHTADYGDSHTGTVQNAILAMALDAVTAGAYGSGSDSSALGEYHNPRVKVKIL